MRLLSLLVMALAIWPATPVEACSCPFTPTVQAELLRSSAVFEGKVARIVRADDELVVTFSVQRAWKGVEQPSIEITTGLDASDCGVGFVQGVTYLVYADAELRSGLCGRTQRAESASEDFELLGAPRFTLGDPPRKDDASASLADGGQADGDAMPDLDTDIAEATGVRKPGRRKSPGCSVAQDAARSGALAMSSLWVVLCVSLGRRARARR